MATVYSATCGYCEEGGEWMALVDRSLWKERHELDTGHFDNFFEQDIPIKHVVLRGLMEARFHGRCANCSTRIKPGDSIVPEGPHYWCEPCARKAATIQ